MERIVCETTKSPVELEDNSILTAFSQFFCRCRQGWKDKAPYQRALTGEQPQTVHNTGLPITERVTSSSSIQRQYGHGLWVREQLFIRSFSSEVVSDLGAHEGKAQEASFVETEADADVDDLDSALQGTGLEKPGWDQERSKSQQALWSKIEVMRQSPQRSVVPHITQWLAEGYALDKRVLVTILIRLRRRARYKQAMEVCFFSYFSSVYLPHKFVTTLTLCTQPTGSMYSLYTQFL